MIKRLHFFLSLALFAGLAGADNQIVNSAFAADLSLWSDAEGTWEHDAAVGNRAAGSAKATIDAGGAASLETCVSLGGFAGRPVWIVGWGKPVGHTEAITINARLFTSSTCSGAEIAPTSPPRQATIDISKANAWNHLDTVVTLPGETGSALVQLVPSGDAGVERVTFFDDIGIFPNLVIDGGFDSGLTQWTTSGSFTTLASDGFPDPVAEGMVADGSGKAQLSQCVEVSGIPTPFDFHCGGRVRVDAADLVDSHEIRFSYSTSTDCSVITNNEALTGTLVAAEWGTLADVCTAPAGTNSIRVRAGLLAGDIGDKVYLDNLYVAQAIEAVTPPPDLTIFFDRFDSGDTSKWSVTVGPTLPPPPP